MYDNSNLEIRCRALWADVLCAVESRVFSINDYVHDTRTQLDCHMISSDSVEIHHPSIERTLIATLDLDVHAIHIKEFDGGTLSVGSKLPFALLGDGNVYVTNGQSLMGDPMAVARQLMSVLLASSAGCPVQAFRVGANVYATQFHPELDAVGMCTRIDVYKHAGYFDPSEADGLKDLAWNSEVSHPPAILRAFVRRYGRDRVGPRWGSAVAGTGA